MESITKYTKVNISNIPDILKVRTKFTTDANLINTPYAGREKAVKELAEAIIPYVDRTIYMNENDLTFCYTDTIYIVPADCKEIIVPVTETKNTNWRRFIRVRASLRKRS